MINEQFAVIIIAAGYSSRMKDFKPLMDFKGEAAVIRLIKTYQAAGVEDIYVVTGHQRQLVEKVLEDYKVKVVYNECFDEGMYTSIQKGIGALGKKVSAFFMQPVDIVLVKKNTITAMMERYRSHNDGVIYPVFRGEKGHPPLIDCRYKNAILTSDGNGGLKKVLMAFSKDSIELPVADMMILKDMDKREDYELLLKYEQNGALSFEECLSLYELRKVPSHIVEHCKKVSEVAMELYDSVKGRLPQLDAASLEAAALLHDIARKEHDHANVGADWIEEFGYVKIAEIIRSHMDIQVALDKPLTEGELLFLADKLVKEDQLCSLDKRFEALLICYNDVPEVARKIQNRWDAAKRIIEKIEQLSGTVLAYG